jgi:hypothetical protein
MGNLYMKRLMRQRRAKVIQGLLTKAFRVLRYRHKMVTRQRFMCCHGCAGTALAEEMRGKLDPETFGGVVLTTTQTGVMVEPKSCRMGGGWATIHDLRLTYGSLTIDGKKYGPDRKTVGDRIVKVFDELGVPYEWDGDPEQCIKVLAPALEARVVRMMTKTATVEVERKGVTYEARLSSCCGRPWVVSNVRRVAPSRARGQTGGRLRQEISQAAVIEVEVMLDRAA